MKMKYINNIEKFFGENHFESFEANDDFNFSTFFINNEYPKNIISDISHFFKERDIQNLNIRNIKNYLDLHPKQIKQLFDMVKYYGIDKIIKMMTNNTDPNILNNMLKDIHNDNIVYRFNQNNLKEIHHNTYTYDGIVDTYHLSTNPNLNFDDNFKSERGGDGDYIYSSLNYEKWLELFHEENIGDVPKYLYIIRLTNPKYKKGYTLFGKETPSEFLSNKENTEIVKYIREVK